MLSVLTISNHNFPSFMPFTKYRSADFFWNAKKHLGLWLSLVPKLIEFGFSFCSSSTAENAERERERKLLQSETDLLLYLNNYNITYYYSLWLISAFINVISVFTLCYMHSVAYEIKNYGKGSSNHFQINKTVTIVRN